MLTLAYFYYGFLEYLRARLMVRLGRRIEEKNIVSDALFETSIRSLPLVYRGKVRDSYAVGDDKLLIAYLDNPLATRLTIDADKKATDLTRNAGAPGELGTAALAVAGGMMVSLRSLMGLADNSGSDTARIKMPAINRHRFATTGMDFTLRQ